MMNRLIQSLFVLCWYAVHCIKRITSPAHYYSVLLVCTAFYTTFVIVLAGIKAEINSTNFNVIRSASSSNSFSKRRKTAILVSFRGLSGQCISCFLLCNTIRLTSRREKWKMVGIFSLKLKSKKWSTTHTKRADYTWKRKQQVRNAVNYMVSRREGEMIT